jgi:anti-sigma factor RsiW
MIPSCPGNDLVELYAMGRLEADAAASFEEHWLVCPSCMERVAQAEEFAAAIRRAAQSLEWEPFEVESLQGVTELCSSKSQNGIEAAEGK